MKDSLQIFIASLDELLEETYNALDSALLTEDFVKQAEGLLVIPRIEIEELGASPDVDSSNTP